MIPTISAFERSPDGGQGLARDMPVRWAFEEVGQPYNVRLLPWADMKAPAHLALQPFGQIPTYEEGTLALFESAAIILHIAEGHSGLLPPDPNARARAIAWMFAAKSTVEPVIVEAEVNKYLEGDKSWAEERRARLDDNASQTKPARRPLHRGSDRALGRYEGAGAFGVTAVRADTHL